MVTAAPILSPEQRRSFDERGVFLTDVLFTPEELEPVRQECLRVYRETMEQGTPGPQQRIRPFLPKIHTHSPIAAAFTRHPVFQRITREIIGPDVDQAWNQACLKLPDQDELSRFPFHQDSKFAKLNDMENGLSCFLALAPLTVDNGTLNFAARAHRSELAHEWNERANWWECPVDAFEIVAGVLEPGQMVVYHPMTPHGSPPNRTAAPREAYLLGFARPDIRVADTGELFGDQRPLLRGGAPAWA